MFGSVLMPMSFLPRTNSIPMCVCVCVFSMLACCLTHWPLSMWFLFLFDHFVWYDTCVCWLLAIREAAHSLIMCLLYLWNIIFHNFTILCLFICLFVLLCSVVFCCMSCTSMSIACLHEFSFFFFLFLPFSFSCSHVFLFRFPVRKFFPLGYDVIITITVLVFWNCWQA